MYSGQAVDPSFHNDASFISLHEERPTKESPDTKVLYPLSYCGISNNPQVGFEPTTTRLIADVIRMAVDPSSYNEEYGKNLKTGVCLGEVFV